MMVIVSFQVHGYGSHVMERERKGLLELKAYLNISHSSYDWPNDSRSDHCRWERVKCDHNSGRVIGLFLNNTYNIPPLNLSLFYPFGELQILNLSSFWCSRWFDDIHGTSSILSSVSLLLSTKVRHTIKP